MCQSCRIFIFLVSTCIFRMKKEVETPLNCLTITYGCLITTMRSSDFRQQVLIAVLVAVGVIRQDNTWGNYDTDDVATGLQVKFAYCVHIKGDKSIIGFRNFELRTDVQRVHIWQIYCELTILSCRISASVSRCFLLQLLTITPFLINHTLTQRLNKMTAANHLFICGTSRMSAMMW